MWPEVEALLLVPISAHALFARPLVVAPTSALAVEVLPSDGRRGAVVRRPAHASTCRPAPGSRSCRGEEPVRLARLHRPPFTDRLVAKFDLPVRGLARRARYAATDQGPA